eukprot:TRINITY_DN9407_c0_g1_i1.p1 TRINITY_DN9407_c0_g1~~TRINITY_DN9407_c0_g1_i1.p1  ORF type:complete len:3269 (-),score=859.42 TRINITY_DN9407_c0_g1_i1:37-8790(-)
MAAYNQYKGLTTLKGFKSVANNTYGVFRTLLRFGGIFVPSGSVLTGASLDLTYSNWNSAGLVTARYLTKGWNRASADLSWRYRDTDMEWTQGGALNDTVQAPNSSVSFRPTMNGVGKVNLKLSPLQVQRWLNEQNYGLVLDMQLESSTATGGIQMYSGDMSEVTYRPTLNLAIVAAAYDPTTGRPDVPGNITLEIASRTSLQVNWTAPVLQGNGNSTMSGYRIEWSTSPLFGNASDAFVDADARSYTISGLTTNVLMWVRVASVNSVGPSIARATTPLFAVPAGVPSAPTPATLQVVSGTQLKATWTAPADNGGTPVIGYAIMVNFNLFLVDASSLSYTIEHLTESAQYTVTVSAVNSVGISPAATAGTLAPGARAPDVVRDVRLFADTASSLRVTWEEPSFDGGAPVSSYLVEASSSAAFTSPVTVTVTATYPPLSANVPGLIADTVYFVRVSALNVFGTGTATTSNPSSARTVVATTATATFMNAKNLYNSTREVVISTQYIDAYNYYNGVTYGMVPTPYNSLNGFMTASDSNGDQFRSLLRFDNLNYTIPTNAVVLDATLTLTFRSWNPPFSVAGFYLNQTWSYDQTDAFNQYRRIGWRYRDKNPTHTWDTPGALQDTHKETQFTFQDFRYGGDTMKEVHLDPAVVQKWISNPADNHGVLLMMLDAGHYTQIVSVTNTELLGNYPQLSITYQTVGNGVQTPVAPVLTKPVNIMSTGRRVFASNSAGSDETGSGTEAFPFKTLVKALSVAMPLDVINLRAGVYAGGVSFQLPNVSLQSYPGEWAVVSAPMNDPNINNVITLRPEAHGTRISNIEITGGYYYALMFFTTWENYNQPQRPLFGMGPSFCIVEDSKLHDTGYSVIKMSMMANRNIFRRNEIYNSGRRSLISGHGLDAVNCNDLLVQDNYIHDISSNGVHVVGGSMRAVVERNLVQRCNLGGIVMGFYTDTEYMDQIRNPTFYENINSTVRNNIVVQIDGMGVGMYAALNPVVVHNTLYAVATVWQSPIILSCVQHWVSNAADGSPMTQTRDATIINNIVVKARDARRGPHVQIRMLGSWQTDNLKLSGHIGKLTMAKNLYFSQAEVSGSVFMWGHGVMLEDEGPNAFVGNVTGWQQWFQTDFGSVEADPVLDTSFRPASCSPAIGMAQQLNVLFDYDSISRTGSAVVGALLFNTPLSQRRAYPPLTSIVNRAGYTGTARSKEFLPVWPYDYIRTRVPRTIVVSTTGSDGNQGTVGSPYKTLSYAVSQALPSDIIRLRGGTYVGGVSLSTPNVTIESWPNEWAIISYPSGSAQNGVSVTLRLTGGGNYGGAAEITLRRLEIVGGYYYALMFNQAGGGSSNLWWNYYKTKLGLPVVDTKTIVEDCILHDSGTNVIKVSPFTNDVIFRRLHVYNPGRRVISKTDASVDGVTTPKSSQTNDTTVPTVPVQDVTVQTQEANGFDIRNGDRLTIQDCYIHDISGTGILLGGGSKDCVIERNLVLRVGVMGILVGSYNTEAEYMDTKANPELFQARDTMVRNNVIKTAGGAGIGIYSALNPVVIHNTVMDVAETMQAAVLYNIAPIYVEQNQQKLPACFNVTVKNNIFQQSSTSAGYTLENRVWTSTTTPKVSYVPPNTTCASIAAATVAQEKQYDSVSKTSGVGGGCPVFPPTHPLNSDISGYPLHPNNAKLIQSIGVQPSCRCVRGTSGAGCVQAGNNNCGNLYADFGGYVDTPAGNALAGIPFMTVSGSQTKVPMTFNQYADESDAGPYPFPANAPIEGTPTGCGLEACNGDRHVIVLDTDNCMLYETWKTTPGVNGAWTAANGAVFNLTSNKYRPLGWTSADAAGLPIYAGLVRYAEVMSGEITHAVRMTVQWSRRAYVKPATHYASFDNDVDLPPMGLRLRLKAAYNCDALSYESAVICRALKKYGAIVADNGANWYISGEANASWNTTALNDLKRIPATMMEAVYSGEDCLNPECSPVPVPVAPEVRSALRSIDDLVSDYNVYNHVASYYLSAELLFVDRDPARYARGNLAWWKNVTVLDLHSVQASPQLNDGLVPQVGSAAIRGGQLLPTSWVNDDFYGRVRDRTSGKSDIGAIATETTSGAITRSVPPVLTELFADPCAGVTPGMVMYVRVNGNDSSCTADASAPLRSLDVAVRRAPNGATILLGNGVHTGGVTIGKQLTLDSVAGEKATIRITFLKNLGDAIAVRANGVVLRNLEIIGGYTYGVSVDAAAVTISQCTIHGAGTAAIALLSAKASNANVTFNEIYNAGQRIPRFGDGVLVMGASDVVVANNTIRNVRSTGVHMRNGAQKVLVIHNILANMPRGISVGNDNGGNSALVDFATYSPLDEVNCEWYDGVDVLCHETRECKVFNNVVVNTEGFGVGLSAAQDAQVAYNTLYNVAYGENGGITLVATQHFVNNSYNPVAACHNPLIVNNLVWQTYLSRRPAVLLRKVTSYVNNAVTAAVSGGSINRNVYFKSQSSQSAPYDPVWYTRNSFSTVASAPVFADNNVQGSTLTFAQWQALHDANSVITDPLLDARLRPQAGSSVINVGQVVSDVAVDYDFRPRGGSPDAGAFEYIAGAPLSTPLLLPANALSTPMAAAGACPVNSTNTCQPPECWIPSWHTQSPGYTYQQVLTQCMHNGAMFPAGNEWSRDISQLASHAMSQSYIDQLGGSQTLHPDWGTTYDGQMWGIPMAFVSGSFPKSKVAFTYASESDAGPYPVPDDAPVEFGACASQGDRHILIFDKDNCKLYELFKAVPIDVEYRGWLGVSYYADSGAVFNMNSNTLRTLGWTSTDAAGLPVLPGLVTYEEAAVKGVINHAVRFTVRKSQRAYFYPPATHYASSSSMPSLLPMGARMRLKATFNCTTFAAAPEIKAICVALQKYGMILADNGGDLFITGAPDPRWNNAHVDLLKQIQANQLEVVNTGAKLCTVPDCTNS